MHSPEEIKAPVLIPEQPEWLAAFMHGMQESHKKPLRYRIYVPEGIQGPLPLVVHFHGVRGRGDDNETQMRSGNRFGPAYFSSETIQSSHPAIVLVPQCPKGKYWVNFTRGSSSKQLRKAMKLVDEVIGKYPVDTARVYLSGQSMGGFATWAALVEYPDKFAAAVSVSGGGNVRRARYKLAAPVWFFHGTNDPLVGVWRSRQMAEALKKAGKEHRYSELQEGRHDIWPVVYGDAAVAKWMFGHQRAASGK